MFIFWFGFICSLFAHLKTIKEDLSMGEEKPETLDFVKDFQEYLSQQTQHVNMISGSVIGVKEGDEIQGGNVIIKCF